MRVSNMDVYSVEVNVVKRSEWEVSRGARWSLRRSLLCGGIVHTVARLGKYPAKRRSVVVVKGRTSR
jgi:hypothetical protein